jgi:signal peptidase II
MPTPPRLTRLFWTTALSVVCIDRATKIAVGLKLRPYVPYDVIGRAVRFTLAYNAGAAFSMTLGTYQRYIFSACAVVALVFLWKMFRESAPNEPLRVLALALAWGGAAGNLIDRIMPIRGFQLFGLRGGAVVDFIDVGYGDVRFWTFNVADSAVTVGAILLAVVLWREEDRRGEGRPTGPKHDAPSGGAVV